MSPLAIVHEDERLIAVAKPAGLATAPGGGIDEGASLHEQVAEHIGGRAWLVHRLDRGTSGVIIFAKDADTHRRLSLQFENRQAGKTYLAVVQGHVDSDAGEISQPLRMFGSGRVGIGPRGSEALTRWTLSERLAEADLLQVRPETGRRHQIRVHLYATGHPILGDTRYGDQRPVGGAARLMLHATELRIPDADGTELVLRAQPPPDFLDIVAAHR